MTNSLYLQAKELQNMAGAFLYEGNESAFTDIQDWTVMQKQLSMGIERLMNEKGSTPNEEAERLLAILMGYAVAIRNPQQIQVALEEAERVLPDVTDDILKCHLMVFCYGVCYDEELGEEIHRLLEELKQTGRAEEIAFVEDLFESMEETLD